MIGVNTRYSNCFLFSCILSTRFIKPQRKGIYGIRFIFAISYPVEFCIDDWILMVYEIIFSRCSHYSAF